jgi:hypothetical protein
MRLRARWGPGESDASTVWPSGEAGRWRQSLLSDLSPLVLGPYRRHKGELTDDPLKTDRARGVPVGMPTMRWNPRHP